MLYIRKVSFIVGLLLLVISGFSDRVLAVDPTLLLGYNSGVNSNRHNLSRMATHGGPQANNDGSVNSTRICVYCHTPHGGTPQSPLWNRKDPNRMGTFPLFDNGPDSARIGIDDPAISGTTNYKTNGTDGVEYPNGATKLCLSCHDGATAIGEMANGTVIAMSQGMITTANLIFDPLNGATNDFSKTHPVSFYYDDVVADYITALPATSTYSLPTDQDVRLDSQSRMQCTTCHNPHMDTRQGGYTLPFWSNYDSNGADEVADYDNTCGQCHTDKGSLGIPANFDGHNL